ncbi:Ubiquitin-conjugating enzyme E2 [Apiospora kogelbergensis]|uniref:Ubiquitin-conjugating enzyme E2 n=1 Tax=Apiospora kogelbergensis TaxID=1337665 RepID=UPI0031308DB9
MARGYKDKYQADLESARTKGISGIRTISKSDVEGQFTFTFSHDLLPHVEVQVVPNEWSSYPSEHCFLAWATTDIPAPLSEPLSNFVTQSSGIQVQEALATLSQNFVSALVGDSQPRDDSEDDLMTFEADEEESDGFDDFDYASDGDEIFGLGNSKAGHKTQHTGAKIDKKVMNRIRRDFLIARASGFKVGVLCGFEQMVENNIVSLSVRVEKLCLSSETREAWNLKLEDYIVLLICYDGYYITLEEALDRGAGMSNIKFCLRKCRRYKPSLQQALRAFTSDTAPMATSTTTSKDDESTMSELSLLSIGESIDTFMNSTFLSLLNLRSHSELSWDQANRELKRLSRNTGIVSPKRRRYDEPSDNADQMKLPEFIARDHFITGKELSLPLIAAQFAMRYFIRCTDYCMVCHQQVEGNFEALKPYVCGDPLCLFQYMSMGLGPSVNQEIRNQPNVVDLLISFCYAGLQVNTNANAKRFGVRDFPTGLNLQVPKIFSGTMPSFPMPAPWAASTPLEPPSVGQKTPLEVPSITLNGFTLINPTKGNINMNQSTFEFSSIRDRDRFKEGGYVAIVAMLQSTNNDNVIFHGRIESITGLLVIFSLISVPPDATAQDIKVSDGYMLPYDQNLDDLDGQRQAAAILMQLQTIPSVAKMRTYLEANPTQQIEKWDRLTPAASKLLRWIVASNRSCIMQVDECPTEDGRKPDQGLARPQEHISGVNGWLQFRFAQGSPEKEVQFQEALKMVDKPHKTILAWHGSAVSNWHSIIRQGLNFEEIQNGRAYGDGVYFGHDFQTSLGYASRTYQRIGAEKTYWPNSALKICAAVSLNELVNLPEQFKFNNSFCIVVQHVHWIQCRYLFVQPVSLMSHPSTPISTKGGTGVEEFIQDPANEAQGNGGRLIVPKGAMPSTQNQGAKRASISLKQDAFGHQGDSEDEDEEDRNFLTAMDKEADDNTSTIPLSPEGSAVILDMTKTDFRPGALDLDTLPRLSPPSYATGQAQKTLAREIQKLQAVQSSSPLHELGWFIDFDKITNMFQWIVELHSFDQDLPLTRDMRKAGITSVVLELRFGRDFPYSPAFRHVTAGGAMCMELLTNTGWTPISSLEGVFLQVRMAISNMEPKPARLESTNYTRQKDYAIGEAFDAYLRSANVHGWKVPQDLKEATTEMKDEAAGASASAGFMIG